MAKQVIILGTDPNSAPGLMNIRYLLWLTPAVPLPKPGGSAYSGASAPEVSALTAGTVIEEEYTQSVPLTFSQGQIEDFTTAHWAARQTYYNSYKGPGSLHNMYIDPLANGGFWTQG